MVKSILLDDKKDASLVSWAIARKRAPIKVSLPLFQGEERRAVACVKVGDHVLRGQKIATPDNRDSVAVHASVSGVVRALEEATHPIFGKVPAITIESDETQSDLTSLGQEREGWQDFSSEKLLDILQSMGVVGMKSAEPVHVKNAVNKYARIHTLVMNACEPEPYLTSEHSLMMTHPVEILKGAELLRKLTNADRVVIAISDNKLEVAELLQSKAYFMKWEHFDISILPSSYPLGLTKPLLKNLFGVSGEDVESIQVHNVATAFAVFEAIALQKPLIERAVTVGGECVVESKNVWIPLGTNFEEGFKTCRGFLREPRKVLMGGPMQGHAQASLESVITPHTQAILALPKELVIEQAVSPCIRCHRCVDACPEDISPMMITLAAERNLFDVANDWGASECIECGNCSYVCPSKRPMVELIRYADTYAQKEIETQKSIPNSSSAKSSVNVETPKPEKSIV